MVQIDVGFLVLNATVRSLSLVFDIGQGVVRRAHGAVPHYRFHDSGDVCFYWAFTHSVEDDTR